MYDPTDRVKDLLEGYHLYHQPYDQLADPRLRIQISYSLWLQSARQFLVLQDHLHDERPGFFGETGEAKRVHEGAKYRCIVSLRFRVEDSGIN